MSPPIYLRIVRVERAKILLAENPSLPINEVASLVGFASHAHFTRVFQGHTGEPPQVWQARV